MFRSIFLVAGVTVCSALVLQTWRVGVLRDRNDVLESAVEGYKEAARFHADYVRRRESLAQVADQIEQDLQEMEGRDEPLSDYLGAAAGRVWSSP